MSNSELSSILIGKIENGFKCQDITQVVEFMRDAGLLKDKHIVQYIIKDEYYKRLKTSEDSCYSIKMDLSVEYDIPFTTVKNIIYQYDHIKV